MPPPETIESIISALDWGADLSRRIVVVLTGYFDDSGTHTASPVAIMAGYVANESGWRSFEKEARRLFLSEGITVLRAKKFEHGEDEFKNWGPSRQLRFVTELFGVAESTILCGASAGVAKANYRAIQREITKLPSISPSGYCLQVMIANLCKDQVVWDRIEAEGGLHLIIESRTGSDDGMREDFERVVGVNNLSDKLHSISFVRKDRCIAIQLADFLAYYSYRFALTALDNSTDGRTPFLDIAQSSVRTIMRLAETFTPSPDYAALLAAAKRKAKPS